MLGLGEGVDVVEDVGRFGDAEGSSVVAWLSGWREMGGNGGVDGRLPHLAEHVGLGFAGGWKRGLAGTLGRRCGLAHLCEKGMLGKILLYIHACDADTRNT